MLRAAVPVRPYRRGFTLVELLVVIAIIGVLVALLLPAVQAAREAARRMQCSNHLRQMGLGFHLHHDNLKACPTGGLGQDPARAFASGAPAILTAQTMGWAYQILPYIEQQNLYQHADDNVVKAAPIKIYFCPSRRPPQVWDCWENDARTGRTVRRAQIDFVGCRGNHNDGINGMLIRSMPTIPIVRFETVTDGLSNTLMVGERAWPIQWYFKPDGPESDWYRSGYTGGFHGSSQTHLNLTGTNPPLKDMLTSTSTVSVLISQSFGSAHPGGINTLVSDGSVRSVSYNVALGAFLNYARRDDGNSFSVSDLGN